MDILNNHFSLSKLMRDKRWFVIVPAVAMALFLVISHRADASQPSSLAMPGSLSTAKQPTYGAAECIAIAARHLNAPVNTISLMSRINWPADEIPSIEAVSVLAQSQKLRAQTLTQLTLEQLKASPYPAILQVIGGRYSSAPDFFVLYVPTQGDDFQIIAPPQDVRHISASQLATRWTGTAIVLSRQDAAAYQPDATLARGAKTPAILKLSGLPAIAFVCWLIKRLSDSGKSAWSSCIARSAIQGSLLVIIAGAGAMLAWHLGDAKSVTAAVAAHQQSAADSDAAGSLEFLVKNNAPSTSEAQIPELTEPQAQALLKQGALFVDARDLGDFDKGHIKGALCVPASDTSRLRIYTAGLPKDQQYIVYCAIKNCQKGHYVAQALMQEGFSRVLLYTDGWAKWTGPKEP